jgi:hypothetical protein
MRIVIDGEVIFDEPVSRYPAALLRGAIEAQLEDCGECRMPWHGCECRCKSRNGMSVAEVMGGLGFGEWMTGGGCTAYGTTIDGMIAMVTDEDVGLSAPRDFDVNVMLGIYRDGDDAPEEACEVYEFAHLSDLVSLAEALDRMWPGPSDG